MPSTPIFIFIFLGGKNPGVQWSWVSFVSCLFVEEGCKSLHLAAGRPGSRTLKTDIYLLPRHPLGLGWPLPEVLAVRTPSEAEATFFLAAQCAAHCPPFS